MSDQKKTRLSRKELEEKQKELQELEQMIKLKQGLPHLFGYPFYTWARAIFNSKHREILCTAANQVSKSSTAIRKNIHLATSPKLWPEYWPLLLDGQKPSLFWYFYPSQKLASSEFEEKWVKEFLPRDEYKDHPQFGWRAEYSQGEIYAVHFNTGVSIYFKSYSQKVTNLQAASVYHLTCDEECPVAYLPELQARLNATNGYFLHVFTATLGQDYWRRAMNPKAGEDIPFKDALKIQVSLYDSMFYEDGTPSPWTKEKIDRAIKNCTSQAEVQRRIYGKFVKSDGLQFESFDIDCNTTDEKDLPPKDWMIFSAVDPGSGGNSGHPAAMVFLAVKPDCTEGVVFSGWRGDGVPTTSEDILVKWRELKGNLSPIQNAYDYSARDFFLIASRAGESFTPADKKRNAGVSLLNTLFKSKMLKIKRGDPELDKLIVELSSLGVDESKQKARDDLIDSLRYCCNLVPWNFVKIDKEGKDLNREEGEIARPWTEEDRRRDWVLSADKFRGGWSIEDEIDEWDSLLSD